MSNNVGRFKLELRVLALSLIAVVLSSVLPPAVYGTDGLTSDRIIVSLGDSYSSGEGIPPFYGKDDFYEMMDGSGFPSVLEDFDFLAHRSKKAWSGQLTLDGTKMNDKRGTQWFFAASSGAETKHLSQKQSKEFRIQLKSSGLYLEDSIKLPPQLEVFDDPRLDREKVDYVTLTLGGNDVGFAEIVIQCATSSAYLDFGKLQKMLDDAGLTKEDHVADGIDSKLEAAYRAIHDKAPNATILVGGYPHLFYSNPIKSSFFSKKEACMVNKAVDKFNAIIEKVVEKCKDEMSIEFIPVADAFGDHGAYDINSSACCINGLMCTRGSDLNTLYDGLFVHWIPQNPMEVISAYSFHPNENGAEIYKECFQEKIDELEGERQPNETGDSNEAYLTEYAAILQEYNTGETVVRFQLTDIDGDAVPELLVTPGWFHAANVIIYTYHQGDVVNAGMMGSWGELSYAEGTGITLSTYSGMGMVNNTFYQLTEGTLVEVHSFSRTMSMDTTSGIDQCLIDREAVSNFEYDQRLRQMMETGNFYTVGYDTGWDVTESNIQAMQNNPELYTTKGTLTE